MFKNKIFFTSLIICFLCGCAKDDTQIVTKLFSLKMGYNETEIGIKLNEHNLIDYNIDLIHRNNFFYITDKINDKVMKFSEKGQLLLLIYNPSTNKIFQTTQLVDTADSTDENLAKTQLYKQYNLVSPEKIESDSDRNIYFVDNNQEYKTINKDKTISDQFVLKFDNNGEFLYKIGRNGLNSEPFSYISQICVDKNDNLVVEQAEETGYGIFQFDKNGTLTKKVIISRTTAPKQKNEEKFIADLVDVKLSRSPNQLYITSQYIRENVESHLISRYETVYEKLFIYDILKEEFTKMEIMLTPKYADLTKYNSAEIAKIYSDSKKVILPMEEFLGVDDAGNTYFTRKSLPLANVNNNNFNLIAYSADSHEIYNKNVKFGLDIVYISPPILSSDGNVFSYYIKDEEINIVQIK